IERTTISSGCQTSGAPHEMPGRVNIRNKTNNASGTMNSYFSKNDFSVFEFIYFLQRNDGRFKICHRHRLTVCKNDFGLLLSPNYFETFILDRHIPREGILTFELDTGCRKNFYT